MRRYLLRTDTRVPDSWCICCYEDTDRVVVPYVQQLLAQTNGSTYERTNYTTARARLHASRLVVSMPGDDDPHVNVWEITRAEALWAAQQDVERKIREEYPSMTAAAVHKWLVIEASRAQAERAWWSTHHSKETPHE